MKDNINSESFRLMMSQLDFSNINASFSKLENKETSLKWNIPPIPKLRNPNIHYRCPKCYNFPLIQFSSNQESIYYACACYEKKLLNIKELFIKENKYMTFLEDVGSEILKEGKNKINNENIGFKCTKHKSLKYNKFKYFCIICKENLCKECCQNHLKNCHDLIVLDFQNFEMYEKIDKINKQIYSEEKENEESNNINIEKLMKDDEDTEKSFKNLEKYKIEFIGNNISNKISLTELEKNHEDFIELVNIIINDYINYPNYYHFFNIENLYRIFMNKSNIEKEKTKIKRNEYEFKKAELRFIYYGKMTTIDCSVSEKMKDIYDRFLSQENLDRKTLNFIYDGDEINENLTIEQIVKEKDKDKDKNIYIMKIIVLFSDEAKDKIKNIICPECKDNILIQFKDYKINCYGCKKHHRINNLLFKEFEKTQKIDLSKIKCDNCCFFNKANSKENEFYKCITCNKNLCYNCKKRHEKEHLIIFHDRINYFCSKHKNLF